MSTAIQLKSPSPAMEACLAQIAAKFTDRHARKALRQSRIDADPRIIARRDAKALLEREYAEGMDGAFLLFADMAAGRLARRSMFASLIRARVALIDNDHATARLHVRDGMFTRRQHWTVTEARPGFVAMSHDAMSHDARLVRETIAERRPTVIRGRAERRAEEAEHD